MKYLILSFLPVMLFVHSASSQCTITGNYDIYNCDPGINIYLWQGPNKGGYVRLDVNQVLNGYVSIAAHAASNKYNRLASARVFTNQGRVLDILADETGEFIYREYDGENLFLYYLDGSSDTHSSFSIDIIIRDL